MSTTTSNAPVNTQNGSRNGNAKVPPTKVKILHAGPFLITLKRWSDGGHFIEISADTGRKGMDGKPIWINCPALSLADCMGVTEALSRLRSMGVRLEDGEV